MLIIMMTLIAALAPVAHADDAVESLKSGAQFGACMDSVTKETRCTFSSHWCNKVAAAVGTPGDTDYIPEVTEETWLKPSDLEVLGKSCSCDTTQIGSCYWHAVTDRHRLTCHVLDGGNAQGAPETDECGMGGEDMHYNEIGPGYEFDDGSFCLCSTGPRPTIVNEGDWTHHGHCQDATTGSKRCSFSKYDCDEGEEYHDNWKSAKAAPVGEDCFCEDVRTGGCLKESGDVMCAVADDSCLAGETWLSAKTLADGVATYNVECYGCYTTLDLEGGELSDEEIVGICLGSVAVLVLGALLARRYYLKKRLGRPKEMPTIEATDIKVISGPTTPAPPAAAQQAA